MKEEEAKGITAIAPEQREQQKKEWDALTKGEKQNKINQYNCKSHKLLQTVNIPLLLILVVISIVVTFGFHVQSGNTYLFFK